MPSNVSLSAGKTVARFFVLGMLASTAAGCSSDVTRFGGLFSSNDQITTGSIPRASVGSRGMEPVPSRDVGLGQSGNGVAMRQQPAAPAYPVASNVSYEPINTSTSVGSGARLASSPMKVQRTVLADPTEGNGSAATSRAEAMAQPFPAADGSTRAATPRLVASPSAGGDEVITGGVSKSGWSTSNAPSVTLRPGESIATLSRRFGVPEKEILRANGLTGASAAAPGQQILIPTFGKPRNAAKAASESAGVPLNQQQPGAPARQDEVAVLPGNAAARSKQQADETAKLSNAEGKVPGKGGTYTVKPGDTLTKIARATGTRIEDLKAANNLSAASIRIGQTLVVPGAGAPAADPVKTASIPAKAEPAKATAPAKPAAAAATPEAYKAPAAKQSVSEVASKAPDTDAPEQTGIGKYRWPVRGAVVAGYGANVEGNRNDGIDISVPQGTPIKAAENGVVIYAGNGLKELGNTVLVRHDDGTVTVYGNADSLNVTRGQKVQRGQTVASSGMSGNAKRPQVHFEVRKDATPVNPMTFLE